MRIIDLFEIFTFAGKLANGGRQGPWRLKSFRLEERCGGGLRAGVDAGCHGSLGEAKAGTGEGLNGRHFFLKRTFLPEGVYKSVGFRLLFI